MVCVLASRVPRGCSVLSSCFWAIGAEVKQKRSHLFTRNRDFISYKTLNLFVTNILHHFVRSECMLLVLDQQHYPE